MMTEARKIQICTVVILFSAAATVFSAVDLTKWKYCSQISFEDKPSGYCRMDITPDIYGVAKPDLSDIRIIDSDDRQVPYLIARPQDITSRRQYSPEIINRSVDDQKNSLVTLDFGQQTMKNSIDVKTGGSNFRRAVKIEGSNDNITFFTLVEQAFVFAVDKKERFRFSDIDMPVNDYRYLRISVSPMPGEQDSPVIQDVQAFKSERENTVRTPVDILCTNHTEDEANSLSVYEHDLVFCNLPVNEIHMSIDDESFYRHIIVEGRNALKRRIKIASEDNRERFREVNEPWCSLTGGTIYRYISAEGKKYEKITLPVYFTHAYRYLKITIRNYDDKPLNLQAISAEMIGHKIIFTANDSTKPPLLYIGSESAVKPQYDIIHKLHNPLEVKAATAMLGAIIENPLFGKSVQKPVPWTEEHKVLLMIVLCVVVLVLGMFIFKSFKSIEAAKDK
jgi:hypothetical protein